MTKEFDFTSWQQQQNLLQTKIEEIRAKAEIVARKHQKLTELEKSNEILDACLKKAQGLNAEWQKLQQSLPTNATVSLNKVTEVPIEKNISKPSTKDEDDKVKQTSADGRYQQFENGIIYDTQKKLEWFIGPNEDINWDINWANAASWVEELNHQQLGNGWRLPDIEELRSLYNDEMKNFHPIFKNAYPWVWSGTLCKDTANKDEDKNYLELLGANKDNSELIGKNFVFTQIQKENLPYARFFSFYLGNDFWDRRSRVSNGRVFGVRSGRRG